MSSASIARQNRRKRLKQNLSYLQNLSATELKSVGSIDDLDNYSSAYSEHSSANTTELKSTPKDKDGHYEAISIVTGSSFINCDVTSRPIGKIFIEGERGFKEIDASQIFQLSNPEISAYKNQPIYQALELSKYFHQISNFCHGLLSGISLLYLLILLHLFSNASVDEESLKYFGFFSKPVHNIFNFLTVICCISMFDRCDINNIKGLFQLIKQFDIKLISLLIYPICLVLSLSTANVDEKLNFCIKNTTLLESHKFNDDPELYYWKTLSISKCFGALLGWIIICWDQNFNLLIEHLRGIQYSRKLLH